ncbi:MAG: hypothetical protein II950_05780 [Prevotella sp.]|nr:hypothetical protein [Prevotella sp.]
MKVDLRKYVPPFIESKECEFQHIMTTSLGGHAGDGKDDGTITGAKEIVFWDDSDELEMDKKRRQSKVWKFKPWEDYLW